MEEENPEFEPKITDIEPKEVQKTEILPKVFTVRDWKEYAGESLLIIFSVLLALFLTEYFNKLHEKQNTREHLKNIVAELSQNKQYIKEMQEYNLKVLANIDSALINKKRMDEIVSNDEFNLKIIAPDGALYRYMNNEAWAVAKSSNIISKLDFQTDAMLTRVYGNLDRMMKVEDEVAKIFFSRESRDPKQAHASLILIRDVYHAWAVDRSESLIQEIDKAILKVQEY